MKKSLTAGNRSQHSAQRVHTLLLLLLGLAFIALGFRYYPAYIAVGLLFVLVSYRGYTAIKMDATTEGVETEESLQQANVSSKG